MRPIAPGDPTANRQKFGMIRWTGGDKLPAYLYPPDGHQIIEATAGNRKADRDRLLLELLQTEDALKIAEGFEL